MVDSILAPLDGSEPAEAGLRWAWQAAAVCRTPLRLLTVVDPDGSGEGPTVAAAEEYLRSHQEAIEAAGLLASTEVVVGEPAVRILERSAEAGLTVLTYGTSRWLVGAALDFVLRNMKRPVLVVRAHPNHTGDTFKDGKVLVPLDTSTNSDRVLAEARWLAKTLSASIVLCHVVEPVGMYLDSQNVPPGLAHVIEDEMAEAESFLAGVAMGFQKEGEAVETVVAMGEPPHEIVRIAERAGAGVIAMATRGAATLSRIMGSVAYAVLLSGRLPCLLVRPDDTG
jgi:nucleotide-binding universal stress UspA family protein